MANGAEWTSQRHYYQISGLTENELLVSNESQSFLQRSTHEDTIRSILVAISSFIKIGNLERSPTSLFKDSVRSFLICALVEEFRKPMIFK